MDHNDLMAEMAYIEKLSTQERLKLARRRRMQQMKKWYDLIDIVFCNSSIHLIISKKLKRLHTFILLNQVPTRKGASWV